MKHDLPSGAVLDITLLGYEQAYQVMREIVALLKGVNIASLMEIEVKDTKDLLSKIQGPLCELLSSQIVFDCAKKCFEKCTVDGLRVTSQTWDERRGDFLPAAILVIKENIAPFFESLDSILKKG